MLSVLDLNILLGPPLFHQPLVQFFRTPLRIIPNYAQARSCVKLRIHHCFRFVLPTSESTDYEGDSSNDVTTDDGAGDDAATEGELSGKEEVQKNQINPRKEQDDAKQGGGDKTGSQKADGGGKKDEENNAPASPDPRRQAFDDIYGRTIARSVCSCGVAVELPILIFLCWVRLRLFVIGGARRSLGPVLPRLSCPARLAILI